MGKQIKKLRLNRQKPNKWERTCERCGNETFSPKRVFKCRFCGLVNGLENDVKM